MNDLRAQLRQCLQGRVCFVGLGNTDLGDDAAGVRLAEALQARGDQTTPGPASVLRESTLVCSPAFRLPGTPQQAKARTTNAHGTCLVAGTELEREISRLTEADFDHVVFLDAVECSAAPGAVVFLTSAEIAARFPQVSTHKLSLGLLAKLIEASGGARAWLLGVQPQSMQPASNLTPVVQATVEMLVELLTEVVCLNRPPATLRSVA